MMLVRGPQAIKGPSEFFPSDPLGCGAAHQYEGLLPIGRVSPQQDAET